MQHQYYHHTNDIDETLAYAHYSDPFFQKSGGSIIFGKEEEGLQWEYSDRLYQWDREKASAAWGIATTTHGTAMTARKVQTYLSTYLGKPVTIVCIIGGVRADSGYDWYCYGFRNEEQPNGNR